MTSELKYKEKIMRMWEDQDHYPDFKPILEKVLNEREVILRTLEIYQNPNNWHSSKDDTTYFECADLNDEEFLEENK